MLLKSYLRSTLRNFARNKFYTVLNVLGLAISFHSIKVAMENPVNALKYD